jgi:integrase/recombinase XerD
MHPLLEEWSDWMRAANAADATIRTRTINIELLCKHAGTDDPVSLTTRQIIRWLSDCKAKWTRCTYATSARVWHQWLVDRGYRQDNPTDGMPVPPEPKSTPRPAPSEAIRTVLPTAGRRARAYITLGTFLGLRVHEIAKVSGEEFAEGWYFVRGKGDVAAALPTHELVEQLRIGYPNQGFWFPGVEDGHVHPDAVSKAIAGAFRKCGYRITAHQLRHWYGTHAQRVGKDARVTQQLMRHADLKSSQIYTEVADRDLIETVRRLTVR